MSKSPRPIQHQTRKKTSFPFEIAVVCTHGPQLLKATTLSCLANYRIPADKITVFVPTKYQEATVKKTLTPGSYHRIVSLATPNTLTDFYPVGAPFVQFEGNIRGFQVKSKKPVKSLQSILHLCFEETVKEGLRLWGFSNAGAPWIPSSVFSKGALYISKSCWGCMNPGQDLSLKLEEYTDYERSIQMIQRDGAVLRLNSVQPVLSRTDGKSIHTKHVLRLLKLYPEWIQATYNSRAKTWVLLLRKPDS